MTTSLSHHSPNRTGEPARHVRCAGVAITEVLLLFFPYTMCLIGLLILGHLALGKQECQKLSILAAPLPGDQDTEASFQETFGFLGWHMDSFMSTNSTFLEGSSGVVAFQENASFVPDATRANDEPVLPYGGGANDISAGFIRLAYFPTTETRVVNGVPVTTTTVATTESGAFLLRYRIMAGEGTDGREADIETLLGDWLRFSEARTQYGFAFGGEAMAAEDSTSQANEFRGRHTLQRKKPGITSDAPEELDDGFAYYSASRNPDFWYGTAQLQGPWQAANILNTPYLATSDLITRDEDFDRLEPVAGGLITPSVIHEAHVPELDLFERLSDISFSPAPSP